MFLSVAKKNIASIVCFCYEQGTLILFLNFLKNVFSEVLWRRFQMVGLHSRRIPVHNVISVDLLLRNEHGYREKGKFTI